MAVAGLSGVSNEIRTPVNVPAPPSAPRGLVVAVDGSTVALAWANTFEGGAPDRIVLEVGGAAAAAIPIGPTDAFLTGGVPAGTYTVAARAANGAGTSAPSNAVIFAVPGPCSGPPLPPVQIVASSTGRNVVVRWEPAAAGPAPSGYVLSVTGALSGVFPTASRELRGEVGPGAYALSVAAVNTCGQSAQSQTQFLTIP
jgi:hypothetical protein